MQFQVPQFIEEEDKIFANYLSFKQFVYLAGGAGISFVAYYFIGSILFAIPVIVPVMILAFMLAFFKHNNRPFVFLLESLFYFILSDKLYIWKKEDRSARKMKERMLEIVEKDSPQIPMVTRGTIHDLSWKLDTTIDGNNVDRSV